MAERRPNKSRGGGLFVRMKLPHHHNNNNNKNGRASQYQDHIFFFSFYLNLKWVICSLFSVFLFTSFLLVTHRRTTAASPFSLSQTTFPHRDPAAISSHSLFESSVPKTNHDLLRDLKVYVYELPAKYNRDWLSDERCEKHLFAAEVAVHRALLSSDIVRTIDPYDADFFFVPVYVSCNFSKINGFPAIGHARSLISSAVELISTTLPFWNRTAGSDHVFVASHDFGACFHTMEDAAMADGIPEILRNSILLQTFGVRHKHPCQEAKHVVVPPYISPESVRSTLEKWPLNGRRDIFAFFRGKMELHPKNISGRFYSKAVRTKIWSKYNSDRRFYLRRQRFAGYQSEMARSMFCLCPLGWAPWSPRLVESVALGCVPVIIADGIQLPFAEKIRWPEISLTVAEDDVGKLGRILDQVARTNLTVIQNNIRDPGIRRALLFHDEMEHGDATWQVLRALAHELDRSRSRRRSPVSDQ
ncbi:Probable glucuronoxylan glucuronosyltransferase irx7 [Dionaea muscipula]